MKRGGGTTAHLEREGDWICANCGTSHADNSSPCRNCAGERFARLEAERTPQIDSVTTVEYRCKECGKHSPRNSTPCNRCGNLTYDPVDAADAADEWDDPLSRRRITVLSVITYLYGGLFVLFGFAWLVGGAPVAGSLALLGAAVAMPVSRTRIENAVNADLSWGAVVAIVVVIHVVAFAFA